MDKLISQQAAIDAIKKRLFETAFNNVGIKQNIDETLVDVAENRLENWFNELPSIQLGTNLAEVGTDLVSRQAVKDIFTELYGISAIGSVFDKYEWADICETTANELPSIQPDTTTNDSNVVKKGGNGEDRISGDCISRQQAIDTLRKMQTYKLFAGDDMLLINQAEAQTELMMLPSAQPEIIHCNSCKYWTQSTGKMKGYGLGRCDFHDADLVTCNGFCYWAERRNDG